MNKSSHPVVPDFNPFSAAYRDDPYQFVAQAHAAAPVFYDPNLGAFVLTKYDDVMEALRDSETFSSKAINGWTPIPPDLYDDVPDLRPDQSTAVMTLDPPDHAAKRQPMQRALTPKLVNALRPKAAAIANELIDSFIDRGECDLVNDFAYLYSGRTIAVFLGFPEEEATKFRHWSLARLNTLVARPLDAPGEISGQEFQFTDEQLHGFWKSVGEANMSLRHYILARQKKPEEDMISAMLAVKDENGRALYEVGEIVRAVFTLIAGGQETTANLIANIATLLTKEPAQQALLTGNLSLVPKAVVEGLRRKTSAVGIVRRTTRDVEVRGVKIPKESIVYVSLPGANMDPDMFEDPGRYDILRGNAGKNVGFGAGRHVCAGKSLAQLEAEVAIDALYRRIPNLKVDLSISREFSTTFTAPALKSLRATWQTT
jgi:cytochrome P450